MVQAITAYTFSAAGKTVTFTDYASIALERIIAIKNLTTGGWIYQAVDTVNYGGSVATNVLTFTASNSGMANGDKLLIKYDPATSLDSQLVTLPAETTKVIGAVRNLDTLGNSFNSAGNGFLKVTDEPRQLFYDPFDAALDTTNMWTSTQGSSGVAALVTTGVLAMGTGTAANGYSKLTSIPTFKPTIPGWLVFSDAIALPDGAAPTANSYRFWGAGTTPGTPTVATPLTDGYGFELNTDGKLRAVVYAGGTRTVIADLSSSGTNTQPLNTSYHRYIVNVRTDRTYFFIDSIDSAGLVATTSFQSSQVQTLSKLYLAIGNSTPPASNTQIQSSGAVVSDTGKNNTQISDATYPFRRMKVGADGGISFSQKATYRAATVAVLVAAVTVDRPFFTIYGSATRTIRVHSIIATGITFGGTTAVAYQAISVRKYSTAVSGGTSTALAKIPVDSSSAASTATNVNAYTAIPTAGTSLGDIASKRVLAGPTTPVGTSQPGNIEFVFNVVNNGTFPVLRGIAEGLGLVFPVAPAQPISMTIEVEYTEEV